MKITQVTSDLETFWDAGYTLRTMTPPEYIFDERFEVQTCSTKFGDEDPVFTVGFDETKRYLDSLPLDKCALVAHNGSGFDHLIFSWLMGLKPKIWADTQAMARPLYAKAGNTLIGNVSYGSLTLAALANRFYDLPAKGSLEEVGTKGRRLAEFTPEELAKTEQYNNLDTEITHELFKVLLTKTSMQRMRLIDRTVRMMTEPQFMCDADLLRRGLKAERNRKRKLLQTLGDYIGGTDKDAQTLVNSSEKLKTQLEEWGCNVPMKPGKPNKDGSEKLIPAFAKTDLGMQGLLDDPDPRVSTAAEVRLGGKSTMLENRIERLLFVQEKFDGWLPVALVAGGATQTDRMSGTWKINQQNLNRIGKKPTISDVLRYSHVAPPGHVVAVADLSAIELRVVHTLCRVESTMAAFREDPAADIYKPTAAEMFGIPVEEVSKLQRFVAKVTELQSQYRSGPAKVKSTARNWSGGEVNMTDEEAEQAVAAYRAKYTPIVRMWRRLDSVIPHMAHGAGRVQGDEMGLIFAEPGRLVTPKGQITYEFLRQEPGKWPDGQPKMDWVYGRGQDTKHIHGGTMLENIGQHLAGQVMRDAVDKYHATPMGKLYPKAHEVHDEIITVPRIEHADECLAAMQAALRSKLDWWSELVTYSEGGYAKNYGLVDK